MSDPKDTALRALAMVYRDDVGYADCRAAIEALAKQRDQLLEELEAGMAGGATGMHGPRCRCLWHEAARAAIAAAGGGSE